jgi:predicted dehydrogenase
MQDGLRINGIKHDKQYVTKPDLAAGGVAFFEGTSASPDVVEQIVFGKAILGEGELTVLPEQAAVVTRILDAIYESAKTGKPVYFE